MIYMYKYKYIHTYIIFWDFPSAGLRCDEKTACDLIHWGLGFECQVTAANICTMDRFGCPVRLQLHQEKRMADTGELCSDFMCFFFVVVENYESMSHLHFNKGDWLKKNRSFSVFFYHHWSSVMSCFYRVETEVTALPHSSRVPHGNLWTHRWTPACSTVQSLDNGTSWHLGWADVIGTHVWRHINVSE